jgi:hypothetical protein
MGIQDASGDDDLTWSIPFAGSKAGLGKNAAYAAARRGEIPTIRFGKKLRVPNAKFLRLLAGEPASTPHPATVTASVFSTTAQAKQRDFDET